MFELATVIWFKFFHLLQDNLQYICDRSFEQVHKFK